MATDKLDRSVDRLNARVDTAGGYLTQLDTSTKKFRKKKGSIVQSAKGNIFEFPVFISSSVPLEYATATSTLLEQIYASYLQMAISINPVIDAAVATSGIQFSALKSDTNKYLEYTDEFYQHDACYAKYTTDECVVEFSMISYEDSDAKMILEQVNHQPLEEFSHFFMEASNNKKDNHTRNDALFGNRNSFNNQQSTAGPQSVGSDSDRYSRQASADVAEETKKAKEEQAGYEASKKELAARQKKVNDVYNELTKTTKALSDAENRINRLETRLKNANDKEKDQLKKEIELTKKERDRLKDDADKREKEKNKLEKEINKLDVDIMKSKADLVTKIKNKDLDAGDLANRARIKAPKFISEKDMEKLNTMKPLLMNVDLNVASNDGSLSPVSYIVGVKTFNRMIDANTIPDVAKYPLQEMNKTMRKAKWRAGELKFFSDIVFHIKQKKQTAVDSRDPKRKWYRRLYELAHMKGDAPTAAIVNGHSVIGSFLLDKMGRAKSANGVIPNVTMVISKSDVDICKMKTGIDLLNGNTAAKLCKELFMMAMVVIDYDEEKICILLPDMHNEYDVHSLGSVNRQIASLDAAGVKTRDIFKMLAR